MIHDDGMIDVPLAPRDLDHLTDALSFMMEQGFYSNGELDSLWVYLYKYKALLEKGR